MMTRERTFRELEMLFPDLCQGDNHILLNFAKAWRSGIIPVAIYHHEGRGIGTPGSSQLKILVIVTFC
jgi:hypothetical protein